jgi:signal transduction histidine kinase
MQIADINYPDDAPNDLEGLRKLLDGTITIYKTEKRYIRKDGRELWVSLTAQVSRDEQEKPQYAIAVVQDIEDRKRAEYSLRESEMRFRTLFEQAPFSVQLLSMDGYTLQVNRAWEDLWRIPEGPTRAYVMNEYNVLTDPQLEAKGIAAYIRGAYAGTPSAIPPILYDPAEIGQSGRARWVSAYAHPIKSDDGTVWEVMLIHHDVTDQLETQRQLEAAKDAAETANRMKSSFLANMSHEIRTPLGAILGFTELLKRESTTEAEREKYLEIIDRSGRSLKQILNDVLDLSQVESGNLMIKKNTVSILEVITEVASLLDVEKKKRGLFLNISIESGIREFIWTDAFRVRQILVNLVGNALKFTLRGGVNIRLHAPPAEKVLVIAISDTGIGIAPESRDALFQPFSQVDSSDTRQFGGTGLGLALSRRLARLLGGDVVLSESASGHGSTFLLQLPTHSEPESIGSQPSSRTLQRSVPSSGQRLAELHILVVDDSSDNRLLLASLLKNQGATVDFAENGRQAVEKSTTAEFDLILMDIQMQVMNGLDATRELRRLGYGKPIIAVTAHAMTEESRKCIDAGCTDHLAKPIDRDHLIRLILTHVSGLT